jgi:hypothetical protein
MQLEFLPPPTSNKAEEYRVLTPEEVLTLAPIFEATGNPLPDPAISTFYGCLKDGKVVGFIVLQLKLHAEPVWIEEGHSAVFQGLVRGAESVIITRCGPQWVYLFAPAGRIAQLAAAMGMQTEPWVVMSKLVMPDIPAKPVIELAAIKPETEAVQ